LLQRQAGIVKVVFALSKILLGFCFIVFSLHFLGSFPVKFFFQTEILFFMLILILGVIVLREGFTSLYLYFYPGLRAQDGGKKISNKQTRAQDLHTGRSA